MISRRHVTESTMRLALIVATATAFAPARQPRRTVVRAWPWEKDDAPAPAPASARDAPKLQAASVKRVPSTRDQSHARGSYAQRRQEQEAEPWLKLEVRQKDEEPSRAKRKKLEPTGS
uniref:Uncharacterized protein n=2 Tax=Pelagomonas calceolata TaxID=35677 RepID=A0A7S3ZQW0_9STRA